MTMANRWQLRRRIVVGTVCTGLAGALLLHACGEEPTASGSQTMTHPGSSMAGTLSAESTGDGGGGVSAMGALAGKLPSTDTVTSSVPAFEIKQKGGGIAGRFEITNANSAAIALDGVNSGVGHALLAWNLGLGRGAVIITSNSSNTLPTLDVSAQSSGAAADIRANNSSSTNPAVKGTTLGLGRAGDFLVNNANNQSPALGAATVGLGSAGVFEVRNTSNTSPGLLATTTGSGAALSASTTGTGVALLANAAATPGNIAIFQSAGVNKIRFNKAGKGFFNNGTQMGGADVAELFEVEGDASGYEPGDVLVLSTRSDRRVEKSRGAYSPLVVGVYATKPGVLLTERHIDDDLDGSVPLGVVGVIPTKVSAENGPIRRGDLLVTAGVPGHAMRGTARSRMFGATIGKALEEFAGPGTGIINVLVNVK
ncbi:MAG TPA: hypothetical protein VLA89_11175 [Gemmatimonadales bacterium]|nr:hypothetical protein [Gemmatimonadales bacterium]